MTTEFKNSYWFKFNATFVQADGRKITRFLCHVAVYQSMLNIMS